jgi:hypothetical protein
MFLSIVSLSKRKFPLPLSSGKIRITDKRKTDVRLNTAAAKL